MQPNSLETSLEIGTTAEKQWFSFSIQRPQAERLNTGYTQPDFPPLWHWLKWPIGLFCIRGQSYWALCRQFCPEELMLSCELMHKLSWQQWKRWQKNAELLKGLWSWDAITTHCIRAHFVSWSLTDSGLAHNNQVISQTSHRFKSSTLDRKKNKLVDLFRE